MKKIAVETDLPGRGLSLKKQTPKVIYLFTPQNKIVAFWDGVPIAVYMDGTLYRHVSCVGPKQAQMNVLFADAAEVSFGSKDFEFVLGQVLSQAGLNLVRAKLEVGTEQ